MARQHGPAGRWRDALALGLGVGLLGMLALALDPIAAAEESFGLHWLFNLRGAVPAPDGVVVVAVDEPSARELGLPDRPRGWPRGLHAELIRHLAREGARLIVFDMTFDTASASPGDDEAFAAAMARAGNVLITEAVRADTLPLQGPGGQSLGDLEIVKPVPPIPLLAQAAHGQAPFVLPRVARVSSYWTFRGDSGDDPTLPVLAFHLHGRDAYAQFVAALNAAGPPQPIDAPTPEARWFVSTAGAASMHAARDALSADAVLAERLRGRLREEGHAPIVRSFASLYADSDNRYLNFYGPPRSIATLSYAGVLQAARSGAAAGGSFKDKTVFVGYSATTAGGQDRLRDDYRTIYSQPSGLDISGVEIAATAFANLLEDRPLRPLAPEWALAIAGAWGLALGLACRLLGPGRAVVLVCAMTAAFLVVVYAAFVRAAWWAPFVVPVGVQMPLALFAGVWMNYRDTRREREVIKRAFGYFLPSAVVEQLSRNLGPVTHDNRVVFGACLSTDVEKYTTLAERLSPAELGALMNQYYAQLFVPVERSRGVVVDVVGDAMVAIWAKASSDVEIRTNACAATLDIQQALARFNATPQDRPALPTRFGLHAGDMLVGSIGASGHYEYRAVGDIVNTASRLQGLNKVLGTQVLASEESLGGLTGFATRPLGSFLLAGKANAVSVVELLGREQGGIDAQHMQLRSRFAAALAAYRERRWREALEAFSAILQAQPDDGPSRFYRARCEELLTGAADAAWTPTVRV